MHTFSPSIVSSCTSDCHGDSASASSGLLRKIFGNIASVGASFVRMSLAYFMSCKEVSHCITTSAVTSDLWTNEGRRATR